MRRWPGWDGGVLIAMSLLMVVIYLLRGRLGGELQLAVLLSVDALYLGGSYLMRREGP